MFHRFHSPIEHIALPARFTFPFHYTPHPLCVLAAEEVQSYLRQQTAWQEELMKGKMFGVLVVQQADGSLGYLAAFSGILAGKNRHDFFVPPVYDLLQPDGFFKIEEEQISHINLLIKEKENAPGLLQLQKTLQTQSKEAATALSAAKEQLKAEKFKRETRRKEAQLTEADAAQLIRESQFQKAEYKRLEKDWREQVARIARQMDAAMEEIAQLKKERKKRSAALQQKLFEQFRMLNARGEEKDLCAIFAETSQKTPPAGAGECAAPKLLQTAYRQGWRPVCMAEFWWGASPKMEIRHHGHYYPACKGKCEPILGHMLQGLLVDENPLTVTPSSLPPVEIVYEDEWLLVVNKPAGMLSVPGKECTPSIYDWAKEHYPAADGPLIVHRLDMATSGLLLLAKNKTVHQSLQMQFERRTVKKRYTAIVDGTAIPQEGEIKLPLCLNPLDRPRQMVNHERGKPAHTYYKVVRQQAGKSRISFFPHTGRTHQLRVHAAHPEGLCAPIVGDALYGRTADRLYLHAEAIEFVHPVTGKSLHIECKAPF